MPRINIDDDIEQQDEFWNLLSLLQGDRDRALGQLVRFFRLTIKPWARGQGVTEAEILKAGLGTMLESGWAVPFEGGYTAKGADDHFAWYAQKVGAGMKGGRPSKSDDNRAVPPANRTEPPVPPVNPPSPSLSPSLKTEEMPGELFGPGTGNPVGVIPSKPDPGSLQAELDAIYSGYPRKEGRKRGMALALKACRKAGNMDRLRQAVVAYAARCKANKTELQYTKQWDTFMGCWEDFVPAAAVKAGPKNFNHLLEEFAP